MGSFQIQSQRFSQAMLWKRDSVMITSLMAGLRATALTHNSAAGVQGVNQNRMALANQANPNMTFGQTAALQQMDKGLELQGAMASMNYEVGNAMQDQAQRMQKKNTEMRQRAIQNGWLA